MKTHSQFINYVRRFGLVMVMMFSVVPARANPIAIPEKHLMPEISLAIGFAILLEVICIGWLLRRFRHPRCFIGWLIGMHLLTYPPFLALLWMLHDVRPALVVAIGEGLVVVFEGALIYLICRFVPPAKSGPAAPSIARCWLVSLIGNLCSAAAFPFLLAIFAGFGRG
jgi:hypothetical protein